MVLSALPRSLFLYCEAHELPFHFLSKGRWPPRALFYISSLMAMIFVDFSNSSFSDVFPICRFYLLLISFMSSHLFSNRITSTFSCLLVFQILCFCQLALDVVEISIVVFLFRLRSSLFFIQTKCRNILIPPSAEGSFSSRFHFSHYEVC